MRTFLATSFLFFFAFAGLSVGVLFTSPFGRDDILLAAVLSTLAGLLYLTWRMYLVYFGRLGLLKPKLLWKPMKAPARKNALASSAGTILVVAMQRPKAWTSQELDFLIFKELTGIEVLGFSRKSRSDDELRSEFKLIRFLEVGTIDRSAPPMNELRGVQRKDVFLNLRKKVDEWYATQLAHATAHKDWLTEVGDQAQDHLLKDGWIAFLKGLPGPDIHLWHGVATDFHELFGDRLDAAFWIVQQPECDRATASDFIRGYVRYEMKKLPVGDEIQNERVDLFASIIEKYNAGFYSAHSIKAGVHLSDEPFDAECEAIMRAYESKHGLDQLPRPKGLVNSSMSPTDPTTRGYASPYAFWDDAGLHLKYPGPNWREVASSAVK